MNILRWKRKSRKKINFKSILLLLFSLIMTTFAWFAYSKVLNPTLNMHIASWDIEYFINGAKKQNPIGIEIDTLYPAMPERTVTIDIKNNGEKIVDIDYFIESITIAGDEYELVQEGQTPTKDDYIILTPAIFEDPPASEPAAIAEESAEIAAVPVASNQLVKGAIINDITKFPFTIHLEHSAQVGPSSQGYLKVSVNWVGDNNELDSEWGYKVGQYLATTGATSVISIELSVDSYQAPDTPVTETVSMPSTTETAPYLPTGFTRVPGTNLETGLVIKDGSGNEYVWIEVPKSSTVYTTATSETDYTNIETDLKAYSSAYRVRDDQWSSYRAIGISDKDTYDALKQNMLKSIYQNGGFYIGRYETGIADTFRTSATAPTQTPVIKANAYPYNYVSAPDAQSLASSMSSGSYTTSLMFGLQWDLVLKYLETKVVLEADLKTDSSKWGNYYNNSYFATNIKAKYSLDNGNTWQQLPYDKKLKQTAILTTGANNMFCKQNIYDLAGNVAEWTLNVGFNNSIPIGGTGGDYSITTNNKANNAGNYDTTTGTRYVGFRVAMFSDINNGANGGSGSVEDEQATITQIVLDQSTSEITKGNTFTLTATINNDAEEDIIWSSSDTSVATVEPVDENLLLAAFSLEKSKYAVVTAVGTGTTTITAQNTDGSISQSCTVTVEPRPLISFTVNSRSYTAEEGMTWAEFVESDYSNGGFSIKESNTIICGISEVEGVSPSDLIENGATYKLNADISGGSND